MKRFLLTLSITACSSDAFYFREAGGLDEEDASDARAESSAEDAAAESSTPGDAPADSFQGDAACIQPGGSACDQVMDAYCARLKACCNGGCGYSWTEGGAACRAHFAAQTEDCSSATFTSKMVCYADTTSCSSAMQAGACNIIMGANPRALCSMFWGQFP